MACASYPSCAPGSCSLQQPQYALSSVRLVATRAGVAGLVAGLLYCLSVAPANSQCAGVCQADEILVGEDADTCHCKDRVKYTACVRDVGDKFPAKQNRTCSLAIGKCFNQKKADFTTAAGLCLTTCLNPRQKINVLACAKNCGVAETIAAYGVASDCLYDAGTTCHNTALAEQKADIEKCKM